MLHTTHAPARRLLAAAALAFLGWTATACADDPADPFTVQGTGSVEGFVYLDANDDGHFDPSDGDEPVDGVSVAAVVRGTESVLETATTGDDGRFLMEDLPAGSHDILFDESTVPDGVNVCQNPVPATVYIHETAFTEVAARSACLVTIAEAQAGAVGDFVIVRGTVTSGPGQISSGGVAIQDDTGGLWMYAPGLAAQGIEIGDVIEVGGTLSLYYNRLELENVTLRQVVAEGVGAPSPTVLTTGEMAAAGEATDPLQNLLVKVEGAELTSGFTSGGSRNATIDDGTGPVLLRVDSGVSGSTGAGILTDLGLEVGKCYDIEGILGTFNGDAELFPRSASDFVEVACGA